MKLLKIVRAHMCEHAGGIGVDGSLQNGGERRPRVFRIEIDPAAEESLVRQERASQIQIAIDSSMKTKREVLRNDLAQYNLLGEVLRSHAERNRIPVFRASAQSQECGYAGESL